MYLKLLPALFLTCLSASAFAQAPSLTAANINPVVNDSFVSVVCDTTGITQGAPGANITWDFHTLATTTLVDSVNIGHVVYAVSGTGYSTLAAAATAISSPTFATSTHAVVTPASSSLANFYIESATKLSLSGIYYNASNNSLYTDPADVLQFPFTYLTTFNDTYAGFVLITGISSPAAEAGTVTVTGDAYGTLLLPPAPPSTATRTYTGVLRVHSYQQFRDSANIFGTPFIQTDTLETYTWYQPNYHSALLTITTVRGPLLNNKVVSYARKQIANHEYVPVVNGIESSLKLYPNPVSGLLNIEYNIASNDEVSITLFDVLGRQAVGIPTTARGSQQISYNTESLPKGLYLIRLQSATETVTRKIEIQ